MRGVNKAIIVGTLGNDPEVRYTAEGKAVGSLSIATNEEWKDKQTGEKQKRTEWHRIVIFGKLAEIAGQYLRKGSQAYFEGRLQTRKWQDQSGQDRYSTEVVLDINGQMQMLGGNNNGNGGQGRAEQQAAAYNTNQPQQASQQPVDDMGDFIDTIPF